MRSTRITALMAILCLASGGFVFGQSTFTKVYNILQTNCAQCHGGSNPIAYDMGTTQASTYAAIVGTTPVNPVAAAKGYKRVDPGHPYNSFLLKKISANLDGYFHVSTPGEGNPMPNGGAASLSAFDAEVIRQWIQAGAPQTGNVVDTALIKDYYTNGGQPFDTAPAPPAVGTGFQIRLGPLFLPVLGQSGNEIEYLKKEQMRFDGDMEITRIDADLSSQSHHFLLFMYDDSSAASSYPQGLRVVDLLHTATDGSKQLQGSWQYDHSTALPNGTAFYYDKRDVLDLNYHLKNYSATQILPADLYINVYTQPRGTGAREMRAQLVNNGAILILPGQSTMNMSDTWGGDDRDIWMLSSHTHKYGTDFDIYVRDSTNGSNGPQIYEGFFNRDYTFNQGFYDWAHPATRIFDPLYTVHQSEGLKFITKYNNTSGNILTFGLTTNDEMQLSTYLYVNTHEVVTVGSTPALIADQYRFVVYPNPIQDVTTVDFGGVRRSGSYAIMDINGKTLEQGDFKQRTEFTMTQPDLAAGVYMLQITLDNGKVLSKKLMAE